MIIQFFRSGNQGIVEWACSFTFRRLVSPAPVGTFVVYPAHVIPCQIDAFPLKQEMPFIFSDKNAHGIDAEIPAQLIYIVLGSRLGDHHGEVSAAIRRTFTAEFFFVHPSVLCDVSVAFSLNPIRAGHA